MMMMMTINKDNNIVLYADDTSIVITDTNRDDFNIHANIFFSDIIIIIIIIIIYLFIYLFSSINLHRYRTCQYMHSMHGICHKTSYKFIIKNT